MPNNAHYALAQLQARGKVGSLQANRSGNIAYNALGLIHSQLQITDSVVWLDLLSCNRLGTQDPQGRTGRASHFAASCPCKPWLVVQFWLGTYRKYTGVVDGICLMQ